MFLSIIIPIYNVEKYIDNTLRSIYSQLNELNSDIEIIMVNDGSCDHSATIAEQYCNRYPSCTQLIHQTNMGLSCARNTGLKIAKGQYIWFVDSDDCVAPGSFCKIIQYIKEYQADILAFDMIRVYENTKKTKYIPIFHHKFNNRQYGKKSNGFQLISNIRETPVQRFLFRHDFLKENQLTFYPGIYHEDNEYLIRCFFHARTIVPIPYASYHYLIRSSGSIMSTSNPKRLKDLLRILQIHQTYKETHCTSYKEEAFFDYYRFLLVHRLLKNKLFHEHKATVNYDKKEFQRIIIAGLRASAHYFLWNSALECFIDLYKIKKL